MKKAVVGAPPAANPPTEHLIFKIEGLDCAKEVTDLKREVGPVVGGESRLSFDMLNGRMTVSGVAEDDREALERIHGAVAHAGLAAQLWRPGAEADPSADRHRRTQAAFTAISGIALLAGLALHALLAGGLPGALRSFGAHAGEAPPLPELIAYAVAIGFGARFVVVKAYNAAVRLRPDMNLLMTVAVVGAIAIGEWFEGAAVAFLFALSLALEGWSVGRARRAIAALLDLAPPIAHVKLATGVEQDMALADVEVGSRFVIWAGERVPLDGTVASGSSAINQAPITGESVPVSKAPGDDVFAGTINGDGALEVTSTRAAADTTLARIIRLVEEANNRRAPSEQWVEKFARIYTPIVMVLAIAVFLVPVAFGAPWQDWLYRALILLVISCPCALVISTPVSIVAALASAARQGVLVKGGAFIELPARVRAIAMDKTGTLTLGKPVVIGLYPLNGHDEDSLLARAAALEARSNHPLGEAILSRAAARNVQPPSANDVVVHPGKGVTGRVNDTSFWLGSRRYMVERGQDAPEIRQRAEELERLGQTVIAVGDDTHICGLIAVADRVRPEAAEIVAALHQSGVKHVIMLTGDNQATAESIAAQTGIDEVLAELLPADKVSTVEALAEKYGVVAMVGDGINDAPALARADLGIAMGAIGSDAAIETADIALMSDDLSRLPWLIRHSQRTLSIIRQNIGFSLTVKFVVAIAAFAGFASLWAAIAADVGASLVVVANGLRLLRPGGDPLAGQVQGFVSQVGDKATVGPLTHGH